MLAKLAILTEYHHSEPQDNHTWRTLAYPVHKKSGENGSGEKHEAKQHTSKVARYPNFAEYRHRVVPAYMKHVAI